ncbi:hypothetical protein BCR42DRAFT_416620 [Absidia repens]|uniref:Uncharacterized protein n=1 Tax=Absidia repens TaxID=90262 RepID=A0A1X2IES9_9FUNG|nr:hypothetical protein BCR42DRAFT_416620 [Absidia repens]
MKGRDIDVNVIYILLPVFLFYVGARIWKDGRMRFLVPVLCNLLYSIQLYNINISLQSLESQLVKKVTSIQ